MSSIVLFSLACHLDDHFRVEAVDVLHLVSDMQRSCSLQTLSRTVALTRARSQLASSSSLEVQYVLYIADDLKVHMRVTLVMCTTHITPW